jgi:hypothetical protein
MRRGVLVLLLVVSARLIAAPAQIRIGKLQQEIMVDGDVSESAWSDATKIEQFVEYWKGDNTTPPVRTVAWIAYDTQALYVAFRADDPSPRDIRAPYVDRDKVLGDQDYVAVLIDGQNDRRSGVAFRLNPRGIQTDSVVNDGNGVEDFSPDLFYDGVARVTPAGWEAEMRIPMSSLRYRSGDPQSWGVILMRNYPRDFRYIMANTEIPKNSGCFLCHAASLQGLSGLPGGRHMIVAPYTTAQRSEVRTTGEMRVEPLRSDIGLDLKILGGSSLTLDATLNPDFSQIESDVPQLSANSRFALSQPEKRTFFLEGVDLLSTPLNAVYTRTIASPAWGIRATGQSGSNAYTLLVAEDRGGGEVILPGPEGSTSVRQDFRSRALVGRVRRSLGTGSFAGVLLSAREVDGGGHNRVLGPDFLWTISDTDKLRGQLLLSDTVNPDRTDLSTQFDGRASRGHAGRVVFQRDAKRYDIWSMAYDYGRGFRSDNGFMPFVGGRGVFNEVAARFYPKAVVSYLRPYIGGGVETTWRGLMSGFYFRGKWGTDGWITYHPVEQERVNGRMIGLSFTDFSLRGNPSRVLSQVQIDGRFGERIDYGRARVGRGGNLGVMASVRPTDHLELQVNSKREWLDVGGGQLFADSVNWLKSTYTFTSRSMLRVIAQHGNTERDIALYGRAVDDREGALTLSALYGYKINWQTTFFLGFGDWSTLDETNRLARDGRSVFLKMSYAIQW